MSKRSKNTKRLKQANKKRRGFYNRNDNKPPPDVPHKIVTRKCLMCNVTFQSSHVGNRICSECKMTPDWKQTHMGL